jgi:hypothetical protein
VNYELRIQHFGILHEYIFIVTDTQYINLTKFSGYFLYHQVLTLKNSTLCPQRVFMCFVYISEQTAAFGTYSINPYPTNVENRVSS